MTYDNDQRGPIEQHLWTAPPRNHDWIAARIGRG
jgi:hypothetical protein